MWSQQAQASPSPTTTGVPPYRPSPNASRRARYQQAAALATSPGADSSATEEGGGDDQSSSGLWSQLDSLSPTTASHVGTGSSHGGAQFLPAMEESVASSGRSGNGSAGRSRSTSRSRSSNRRSDAGGGEEDDAEGRSTRG